MNDNHHAKEWSEYCPSIETHPHNQFVGEFYILLQGNKKPRSIIVITVAVFACSKHFITFVLLHITD